MEHLAVDSWLVPLSGFRPLLGICQPQALGQDLIEDALALLDLDLSQHCVADCMYRILVLRLPVGHLSSLCVYYSPSTPALGLAAARLRLALGG